MAEQLANLISNNDLPMGINISEFLNSNGGRSISVATGTHVKLTNDFTLPKGVWLLWLSCYINPCATGSYYQVGTDADPNALFSCRALENEWFMPSKVFAAPNDMTLHLGCYLAGSGTQTRNVDYKLYGYKLQ